MEMTVYQARADEFAFQVDLDRGRIILPLLRIAIDKLHDAVQKMNCGDFQHLALC